MNWGRTIVGGLVVLGLAAGCETTRVVGPAPSADSIASINAASHGRDMEVRYRGEALAPPPLGVARRSLFEDGNKSIARVDASQITFVKQDDTEQAVPSRLIRRVTVTNHARGALHGAKYGAIAGALFGVVLGTVASGSGDVSAGGAILSVGVGMGLVGAVIGAGSGALVGYRENFVFDEKP